MGALARIALLSTLGLVACGDKGGDRGSGSGGPIEPPAAEDVIPGEGLTPGHYYRIVQVGATIADRKALGLEWDVVGPAAPDARFDIGVSGETRGTCRGDNDAHKTDCTPKQTIDFRFDSRTTVSVNVYDRDLSGDERIGQAHLTNLMSKGMPGPALPMSVTGRLRRVWIKLIEIEAPRSLWASYRVRVFGLLGGIGGALLLLFLFKGFWFDDKHYLWPRTIGKLTDAESSKLGRLANQEVNEFAEPPAPPPPEVVQVVKVRCQYCAALLDEHDHTCHKCGGSQ